MAFFAIPAVAGGVVQVVRAATPYIARELAKRFGAKQISKTAANKMNKNPSTITNINQLSPKVRTAGGVKPFRPLSGRANAQQGRKFGEGKAQPKTVKPKTTAVTAPKGNTKVAKRVQDLVAAARTSPAKPRSSSVAVPKPRPTKPSMRNITPPKGSQRALPKAPPSRPIPQGQRVANMGKATIPLAVAASKVPNTRKEPQGSKAKSFTPKTKEGGPGRKFAKAKPQGDARYRPGKGGQVMPKKFDGGYNSKTQRLVNISKDRKKSTYEIPKGMTTKQATNLLKDTVKKKAGGTPSKYKGFSKLPEKVQKKMSPKLAAKYEAGGYLSTAERAVKGKSKILDYNKKGQPLPGSPKDRATKKLEAMKKTPKKKLARSKPLKGGGSVGSSKVARQVKGFGAARKPKK